MKTDTSTLLHDFPFDPSYGYTQDQLLGILPPAPPQDFEAFWKARYTTALRLDPCPRLVEGRVDQGWEIKVLTYRSTGGIRIRGWVIEPKGKEIRRGFVCGHGYGGISGPDLGLPFDDAVLFFPCLRGLGISSGQGLPQDPAFHVLHNIGDPEHYIHGGCVDDMWLCVSSMLQLYPQVVGHVGMLGISFGGGIGMLALPWDGRISRGHFEVPSFGNHQLRMTLETVGSGAAVNLYQRRKGNALETLQYFDAATAATNVQVPVQIAAALFDPFVAPPGQFSIYNALPGEKELFVLSAGHFEYPGEEEEHRSLLHAIGTFFSPL